MVTAISGVIDEDITDVVMIVRCTECGCEVETYRDTPPPHAEELRAPAFWRRCVAYGDPSAPSWWFCPHWRFFGVAGTSRVRLNRPDDVPEKLC